jgi:hypothetical protein
MPFLHFLFPLILENGEFNYNLILRIDHILPKTAASPLIIL